MHRERQRREGRKTVLFPGCSTLKSIPEMSVELLLYSLNERGVEQTRSQIALFARGASLKAEENAARAPKVRMEKIFGLFWNYALVKYLEMLRKRLQCTENEQSVKQTGSRAFCLFLRASPAKIV